MTAVQVVGCSHSVHSLRRADALVVIGEGHSFAACDGTRHSSARPSEGVGISVVVAERIAYRIVGYINITEFNKLASNKDVTLSISLSSATGEVSVSNISSAELKVATPAALWIIIIIVVTFIVLLCAIAIFTRFYHRYRRRVSRTTAVAQRDQRED